MTEDLAQLQVKISQGPPDDRLPSIEKIGELGALAVPAVPSLAEVFLDDSGVLRLEAFRSLAKIFAEVEGGGGVPDVNLMLIIVSERPENSVLRDRMDSIRRELLPDAPDRCDYDMLEALDNSEDLRETFRRLFGFEDE